MARYYVQDTREQLGEMWVDTIRSGLAASAYWRTHRGRLSEPPGQVIRVTSETEQGERHWYYEVRLGGPVGIRKPEPAAT